MLPSRCDCIWAQRFMGQMGRSSLALLLNKETDRLPKSCDFMDKIQRKNHAGDYNIKNCLYCTTFLCLLLILIIAEFNCLKYVWCSITYPHSRYVCNYFFSDLKFVGMFYTPLPNKKFYISSFTYSAIIAIKPNVKYRFASSRKTSSPQRYF